MPINSTIEADTLAICNTKTSHVRLMNDSRWAWLMVLPINSSATELHHLEDHQRAGFLHDVTTLSQVLQEHTSCQSVNIAMLGNVVDALHCHVVARNTGDPNWPKPVWGFEQAVPYNDNLPATLLDAVCSALGVVK